MYVLLQQPVTGDRILEVATSSFRQYISGLLASFFIQSPHQFFSVCDPAFTSISRVNTKGKNPGADRLNLLERRFGQVYSGSYLVEAMPPAKRARATATGRLTISTRGKQASARNALSEKPDNVQEDTARSRGVKRPASDDTDALEDQDAEDQPKAKRGRRPNVRRAQKNVEPENEDELSQLPIETTAPEPVRRGRKPKANAKVEIPETQQPEREIPETQQVDMTDLNMEDERIEELPTHPSHHRQGASSVQPHQSRLLFSANRRPIAASDSELNDPTLRRRIGELTRKHETLEAKYRDLQEIGIQEAERNFDRLRKQSEERANSNTPFDLKWMGRMLTLI